MSVLTPGFFCSVTRIPRYFAPFSNFLKDLCTLDDQWNLLKNYLTVLIHLDIMQVGKHS
jgi:hypothetical protein